MCIPSQSPLQLVVAVLCFSQLLQLAVGIVIQRHLTDILLAEFRKNPGNVISEDAVRGKHQHLRGFQFIPVVIQKIRDAMKCHGCLAASGTALYDQDLVRLIADDLVLLLLNRSDNALQAGVCMLRKRHLQNLIVNVDIALDHILQSAITNLILALPGNFSGKRPHRRFERCRSLIKVVEQTADGCAPVIDQRKHRPAAGQVADSDIVALRLVLTLIAEIHTAKIRILLHLLIALHILQIFFLPAFSDLHGLLVVVHLITVFVKLCIILPEVVVHAGQVGSVRSDLLFNLFQILSRYLQNLLQVLLFYLIYHRLLLSYTLSVDCPYSGA